MRANRAGQNAEETLATICKVAGFDFDRQVTIGRTIYGTIGRVDFVIRNVAAFPAGLILESKWQDGGGSADEKFPYLAENIRLCYPLPTIVLVMGGGCRPGAIDWLRARCDGAHLIAVYNLEEFLSWANRVPKATPAEVSR